MTDHPIDAVLVCVRAKDEKPLYFFDDLFGACANCGHRIRYRPHAAPIKTKVCGECAHAAVRAAGVTPQVFVTPETVAELNERAKQ